MGEVESEDECIMETVLLIGNELADEHLGVGSKSHVLDIDGELDVADEK